MPAVLYSGNSENKLPPGLTSIDIKSLTPKTNLRNKYVKAIIDHKYQHNKDPEPSLKMVLKNNEGNDMDLLAIGQVADDLDICVQGDILIFLKFEVEDCPRHYRKPFQIVVDDTGDIHSLVWIFKQNEKSKRPVQSKPQLFRYTYTPLAELKVNDIVDVYGVVKFCKPPTKTRGSDYCCTVSLIDSSFNSPDNKLLCNIFSSKETQLPNVDVGNIIRFHRLKIQNYQGKIQGYNGPGFQWLLFRGSVLDRQASSSSYTFESHDEDKVKSLLEWWQKNGSMMSSTSERKCLSEVRPKDFFDFVCQVIRICDLQTKACKLCRVWDGTKFESSLKMAKEEEFNETVLELGTLMEASTDLAVDVYLFDNHVESAKGVLPGDFIQLTNLHAALVSGQVELTLHGGTLFNRGLVILSRDLPQVKEMETVLNAFIKEKTVCNLQTLEDTAVVSMPKETIVSPKCVLKRNTGRKANELPIQEDGLINVTAEKESLITSCYVKLNAASVMIVGKHSPKNDSGSGEALMLATDSGNETNELADSEWQINHATHDLEVAGSICEKDQVNSPNVPNGYSEHEPLEISDNGQSICDDSDLECQVETEKQHIMRDDEIILQDSNISSSASSKHSQCLLPTNTQQIDTNGSIFPPTCNNEPHSDSSQESFHTACSQDIRETTNIKPTMSDPKTSQRTFLSLKRKLDSQEMSHGDIQKPLTISKCDVFSLNSSVLCFDTVEFTETGLTTYSQEIFSTAESEADIARDSLLKKNEQSVNECALIEPAVSELSQSLSETVYQNVGNNGFTSGAERRALTQDSDTPLRCMLKTASTVVGHTHVPISSLNDVLQSGVPNKFKVLARIKEFTPRPVSAANLVQFVCFQCHHIESAKTLQVPLDTCIPEHVCPNSDTQPVELQPTLILTFHLCDGQNSLVAYLWHRNAVQFFCGIDPSQILSSNESFQQVEEWLEGLCPHNSSVNDRPLLECCLFSYGTEGNVKYQIFDTELV